MLLEMYLLIHVVVVLLIRRFNSPLSANTESTASSSDNRCLNASSTTTGIRWLGWALGTDDSDSEPLGSFDSADYKQRKHSVCMSITKSVIEIKA